MLQGLHDVDGANSCLPFVRQFYGRPSQHVWHDSTGQPHIIRQGEGGEQGDPLMPALFALGQRAALQAVQHRLRPDEMLLAYLDDIYAVATPDRVRPIYDLLAHELYTHSHIQLNSGKTRVWNTSGNQPPHIEPFGHDVWVGNTALPPQDRGLTVLGAPIGSNEFIQTQLRTALETTPTPPTTAPGTRGCAVVLSSSSFTVRVPDARISCECAILPTPRTSPPSMTQQ